MRSCFPVRIRLPKLPPAALHIHWPVWFSSCFGLSSASRQDFDFQAYHESDEFDHLLSTDPSTRSFLSRLPFKRGTVRNAPRPTPVMDSSDSSLRSLFVDDRDAEFLGDESISMLLTATAQDTPVSDLPLGHRSEDGQDEETLRLEEEELRRQEEEAITRKRENARLLALERGLIRDDNATSNRPRSRTKHSSDTRSPTSPANGAEHSPGLVQTARQEETEEFSSTLPHRRPA